MNCKQGDLAVMVKSGAGNDGAIVQCLRLATAAEVSRTFLNPNVPHWLIDRPLKSTWGDSIPYAGDSQLKPLRDPGDSATDEMLMLVGSPNWEQA